jgi:hypothetical protein
MFSPYDTWKTTDWDGEDDQVNFERAVELLEENGQCDDCGDDFEFGSDNVSFEVYYEGKYPCLKAEVMCENCGAIVSACIEPDF